ncbi:MAG: transposase [Chloroflexaceae bacterium]
MGTDTAHLEVRAKTGPERTVDLRQGFNALRYKLRTGCQWRLLPKSFPARSTVQAFPIRCLASTW